MLRLHFLPRPRHLRLHLHLHSRLPHLLLSRGASSTAPPLTSTTDARAYLPRLRLHGFKNVLAGLSPYRRRITSTTHPAARLALRDIAHLRLLHLITNVLVIDCARRSAGS